MLVLLSSSLLSFVVVGVVVAVVVVAVVAVVVAAGASAASGMCPRLFSLPLSATIGNKMSTMFAEREQLVCQIDWF